MENIIVRETASEMKTIAKNALNHVWAKVFIGVFIYYILTLIIPQLINLIIPNPFPTRYNEIIEADVGPSIGGLYQFMTEGAFTAGFSSFLIAAFRKRDIHAGHLFDGFEYYVKSFSLLVMIAIFTFFWTLLLFVPGIIAAICYSQAFYILADNPEKGVMQCIRESKEMMRGNKGRYFYTCLSFLGWMILAGIPSFFTEFVPAGASYDVLRLAVSLLSDIPYIFVLAYMNITLTVFYDLASGHLAAQAEPAEPQFREEDDHF